ncbi:MAG: AAA family ATPase [Wenzhouxiangellaceae bacterium]|nr:AAA family ATPase [Wenzhouxiangellaceae bacterium]
MAVSRVSSGDLRWSLDPRKVSGDDPSWPGGPEVVEQLGAALELSRQRTAARHGHVFVRGGEHDATREQLVELALDRVEAEVGPDTGDRLECCFVHNFERPDCPRLLRLPSGQTRHLRLGLLELARFIRDGLEGAMQARPIRNRLQALDDRADSEMRRITAPLEKEFKPHGLVLVREEVGQLVRLTVHVQQTGRVITQDDLANLVAKGQVSPEEFEDIRQVIRDNQPQLREITEEVNRVWKRSRELGRRLLRAETRRLLADMARPLLDKVDVPEVREHVEAIIGDVLDKRIDKSTEHLADPELLYSANLVHSHEKALPVVRERFPTPRNLTGTIDPGWLDNRRSVAAFHGIRSGSILEASGGFLIVDAQALLEHPRSLDLLRNALFNGHVSIDAPATATASPAISLKPDPVPTDTRLVVMGSIRQWHRLSEQHPEFMQLFSAPVDVPDTVARDARSIARIASRIRRAAETLGLPTPANATVAAIVEHAARLGGAGRLSTRIDELTAVLQRAWLVARATEQSEITPFHVEQAVAEEYAMQPPWAGRPGSGTTGFPVRQERSGQVFVASLETDGAHRFGQLVRVRAAVADGGPARFEFSGTTDDGETGAAMRLETSLFQALRLDRPVALRTLIECVNESAMAPARLGQSVILGGLIALLSRLADVPLRQDLAVVGGLDVDGRLVPVDSLNERVEEVFRIAETNVASRVSGVIVPALQREELMLAPRIVDASRHDLFEVFAAGNLVQTLELLAGSSPGTWRDDGFADDTLYGLARARVLRTSAGG